MIRIIYLKQYLFETNSHYENRINAHIVAISDQYEIKELYMGHRQVTIYYETKKPLREKPKIGFPVTSNNI